MRVWSKEGGRACFGRLIFLRCLQRSQVVRRVSWLVWARERGGGAGLVCLGTVSDVQCVDLMGKQLGGCPRLYGGRVAGGIKKLSQGQSVLMCVCC